MAQTPHKNGRGRQDIKGVKQTELGSSDNETSAARLQDCEGMEQRKGLVPLVEMRREINGNPLMSKRERWRQHYDDHLNDGYSQ